jgi:hypothetical protein
MTLACALAIGAAVAVPASADTGSGVAPNAVGALDCNGLSPIQKSVKLHSICSDPRSIENGVPARFEDNGKYIGHDEPSARFLSDRAGSANDVTWNETLPSDPAAVPTVATPGSDVTHWFELSVAPWISTTVCDPNSAPILPCTPRSDANAPRGAYPGGGGGFVELQF